MSDIGGYSNIQYMSQGSSPVDFPNDCISKNGSECQQKSRPNIIWDCYIDTQAESNVVGATTWGRDVPATNNEVASWIATGAGAMIGRLGRTTWGVSSTGAKI